MNRDNDVLIGVLAFLAGCLIAIVFLPPEARTVGLLLVLAGFVAAGVWWRSRRR